MSFLTKLFGQSGKVRFEAITCKKNEKITGTCPFEAFNISYAKLEQGIQRELEFELGEQVCDFKIVDMILH